MAVTITSEMIRRTDLVSLAPAFMKELNSTREGNKFKGLALAEIINSY